MEQGKIVTVSVQITTPDELDAVILEVLMPGGLEPIDPAAYPGQRDILGLASTCQGRWCSMWSPLAEFEPSVVTARYTSLYPGTATFVFKAVAATPGEYALPPVKAWVQAQPEVMGLSPAGRFVVCPAPPPLDGPPAARAPGGAKAAAAGGRAYRFLSVSASPDKSGARSGAFATGDPSYYGPLPPECASAAAARKPPLAAAKSCPRDCSGAGVCDLASGKCMCAQGLGGDDCSHPVPA